MKKLSVFVALSVLLLVAPISAKAGTLYVDDDGLCGGNIPCYTDIQSAVNAANPGDTVYVYAGTYYENVTINMSLTLEGEDRETTIIDGGGTGNVIYITANHVTVSGVTVKNGEDGIELIPNWSINHVVISDCVVTLNTHGISAAHVGGYITIEKCEISKNKGHAIYSHQFNNSVIRDCKVFENENSSYIPLVIGWCSNASIVNCDVYLNKSGRIIVLDSTWNCIVEGNNVRDNEGVGIDIFRWGNGYGNIVRNNVVAHNTAGIRTSAGYHAYNNLIYHNDMISNTTQADDIFCWNQWDNGYPSGGNYWSDYTGADEYSGVNQDEPGPDAIGDTPYVFDNNQDNYPLMSQWNTVEVVVDIKPGSDPNCIKVSSKGNIPVAILSTSDIDLSEIDVATIQIDDDDDAATPGITQVKSSYKKDVDGDGLPDRVFHFSTRALSGMLADGITLYITGELSDGTAILGSDVVYLAGGPNCF